MALFDACVLYPAPLRDLLMRLALLELFWACRSAAIHGEWIEAVLRIRPGLRQAAALAAVAEHQASLRVPPKTADDDFDTLMVQESSKTIALLQQHRSQA